MDNYTERHAECRRCGAQFLYHRRTTRRKMGPFLGTDSTIIEYRCPRCTEVLFEHECSGVRRDIEGVYA